MSSNPKTESSKTMDVQTAQRIEQEKITRRAALRKLGFGAGLAAFSMLGVDDLARMVGKRMERMAGDSKVAEQVAKEFQAMGVASAAGPSYPYYPCISNYNCTGCGGSASTGDCCSGSSNPNACCGKSYGPSTGQAYSSCQDCCAHATGNQYQMGFGDFYQACVDQACGQIV